MTAENAVVLVAFVRDFDALARSVMVIGAGLMWWEGRARYCDYEGGSVRLIGLLCEG